MICYRVHAHIPNFQEHYFCVTDFHLNSPALPHYLVEFENSKQPPSFLLWQDKSLGFTYNMPLKSAEF